MSVLTITSVDDADANTIEVFALSVGDSGSKLAQVLDRYRTTRNRSIYICRSAGPLGVIGFEALSEDEARIHNIAVDPDGQRSGVGRMMINASLKELGFKILRAETDAHAVAFYRACGFEIEPRGEKYPGVERYECTFRVVA